MFRCMGVLPLMSALRPGTIIQDVWPKHVPGGEATAVGRPYRPARPGAHDGKEGGLLRRVFGARFSEPLAGFWAGLAEVLGFSRACAGVR